MIALEHDRIRRRSRECHRAAGNCRYRSGGRPARRRTRSGAVVRTGAQPAGTHVAFRRRCAPCAWSPRELPPFVPAGRDLFDDRPAQALPWDALRERLRARLGDDALYAARASRPDHARNRRWRRASMPLIRESDRAAAAAPPDLAAAAADAVARSRAAHPGRPRAHRKRLVGWRRRAPRLLRGADHARPARLGLPAGRRCSDGAWMLHGWFA